MVFKLHSIRVISVVLIGFATTWCLAGELNLCGSEKEGRVAKSSINYLFPPTMINELPTWRFVLHFKAPSLFRERRTKKAIAQLKSASFKAVIFPFGLDNIAFEKSSNTVDIPVEVPPSRREQPGSLTDYESDVWKIYGNMVECGFGDLYYEAIDWRD